MRLLQGVYTVQAGLRLFQQTAHFLRRRQRVSHFLIFLPKHTGSVRVHSHLSFSATAGAGRESRVGAGFGVSAGRESAVLYNFAG